MSCKCPDTDTTDITCWTVLRGKSGTWAVFIMAHCGYWLTVTNAICVKSSFCCSFENWKVANEIVFLGSLLLMPHINKLVPWERTEDLSEAFWMWLASTIVSLFIHWISASYIQLLSIGLFVFCKQPVCLLFHPRAYLDQTFNSTVTLSC